MVENHSQYNTQVCADLDLSGPILDLSGPILDLSGLSGLINSFYAERAHFGFEWAQWAHK